jgi:hypothetical protein
LDTALAQMVQSGNSTGAADVFARIKEQAAKLHIPVSQLTKDFPEYKEAMREAGGVAGHLADGSLNALGEQAKKTGQDVSHLNDEMKKLGDTLKGLNDPLYDANDASIKYAQSLAALKTSLAENGKTFDVNTESGQKNLGALDDLGRAAEDLAVKQAQLNGDTSDMATVMTNARQNLVSVLVQMGFNQTQAQSLAETYLKLDGTFFANVTNNIPDRIPDAQTYADILAHIPASVVTRVTTYYDAIKSGYSAQAARNQSDPARAQATGGINVRSFAGGGFSMSALPGYARIAPRGTVYQYAESSGAGESFVPLAQSRRAGAERVLSDTAHLFGGAYLPAQRAAPQRSAAPINVVACLAAEDRELLRAAASRDISLQVGPREIARASASGTRDNRRRGGRT